MDIVKFDLMENKPKLDILTLNYIWDILWRSNACNRQKNAEQRIQYYAQEHIMKMLENMANNEIGKNKNLLFADIDEIIDAS